MSKKSKNINIVEELIKVKKKTIELLGRYQNDIVVIRNNNDLEDYINKIININVVSIDTETNNSLDPLTCKLMGLCLYAPGLKQAYIPVNHRDPITKIRLIDQVNEEQINIQLKRIIDSKVNIVMHNGKFDYEVLKCTTFTKVVPNWDTMIAAKLLNENESASLKDQYINKVDPTHNRATIDKLFTKVKYADVDPNIFALYAATDAFMTYKLFEYQYYQMMSIENEKIRNLFYNIEMPMVEIVGEMELYGVKVDLGYCNKLKVKYESIIKEIDDKINKELKLLDDVLEHWKNTKEANEKEIITVSSEEESKLDLIDLVRKFPYISDNGKRYKIGKRYVDLISNPINLNSPKQLSVLFYDIFGAVSVSGKNPKGTGKGELPLLTDKFKRTKEKYNLLIKYLFDKFENEEEIEEISSLRKKDFINLGSIVFDYSDEEIKKGKDRLNHIINICESLVERNGYKKLLSTFVNPVPSLVNHWDDNKVRFHLNSLGARTGRFTSGGTWKFYEESETGEEDITLHGMNSQNIPTNTSKEIRLMFLADEGRIFVGGDWSQQEPKLTAHISGESKMIKAFEDGKDIYATIAQMIYKNKYEENLEFEDEEKTIINPSGKKRRKVGKTVILATMYGMSASTIASRLEISVKEAEQILDDFYSEFKELSVCQNKTIDFCREFGFVEDIVGRRRRLPNIQLPLYKVRFINKPSIGLEEANTILNKYINRVNEKQLTKKELAIIRKEAKNNNIIIESNDELIKKAERQSFNARIQGSAATMGKYTMILLYNDPVLKKCDARLVFQIHDELIMDCPIEHVEKVKNRLKKIMETSATNLGIFVPMKCDIEVENRWGEATITSEIKEEYLKWVEKGVKDPLLELSKQYPNFPSDSLEKIVKGETNRLEFAITDEPEEEIIVEESEKSVIKKVVEPKVKEVKPKVKKPKKEKVNLTYNSLLKELLSVGRKIVEVDGETYTFSIVGEKIIIEVLRKFGAKSSYKIPIEFKDGTIDLEYEGEVQNKLLKVIFNKVSLPDEEAIEERVIKSKLSKQLKKAIQDGIITVEEENEEVINEDESKNQEVAKEVVLGHLVLSEEVKRLIIKENNEFKEEQYGSLSKEERKKLAAFYTPGEIVIRMIEKFRWDSLTSKNIFDPTCGSGNLLAGCLIAGADSDKIYGNEINPEMVELCRKRLNKVCDMLGKPHIRDWQIHVGNALSFEALTQFGPEYCEAQENELREFGVRHTGFVIDDKVREEYKGKPKALKKYLETYGLYDLPSALKDENED